MSYGKRLALEAARGALLSTHAATGLSSGAPSAEATRLLRAAEGILRAAVAVLARPHVATVAAPPVATPSPPPRRRRPRGRRNKKSVVEQVPAQVPAEVLNEEEQADDVAMGVLAVAVAPQHPVFVAAGGGAALALMEEEGRKRKPQRPPELLVPVSEDEEVAASSVPGLVPHGSDTVLATHNALAMLRSGCSLDEVLEGAVLGGLS